MHAMVLKQIGQPLHLEEIKMPTPSDDQILIRVEACGICRTDLHVVDGDLPNPKLPIIPGHQIVGVIEAMGNHVTELTIGQRVGVPWLGGACGHCHYCNAGKENLCDNAIYTGYQVNGGFAEYCTASHTFCFPIPEEYSPAQAAPLLCAGLIGYRSLRMTGDAKRIGFYGFGAAAHILIQVTNYQNREVYAFTRKGDSKGQEFAKKLGAAWAGDSEQQPPVKLDAAIIFAPVGNLVPTALKAIDKGGSVVCAGIHMSDIPSFPYSILWEERSVRSVANLTRQDGKEFLALAPKIPIKTEITTYPLEQTNQALDDLRKGKLKGSAVIVMDR